MRYNLSALTRRTTNTRRREIVLRPIVAPGTLATDLYRSAYDPVIKAWQSAIPTIMAEYDRTLSAMTQDSPADIGSIMERYESDLLRLVLTLKLRLADWGVKVEKWHRGKWQANVKAATSVDISAMIGPADARMTVGAAIEQNVGLVKSVSDQARARIGDAVFRGLNRRAPAREVAKELSDAVGMGRRRALNIASDQTSKLAAQLNTNRAIEAGLEHYEWVHSGKLHPREEHKARNGKRYKYGEPSGDEPSMLPFCGCTARAVLSLDDEF